MPNNWKTYKLKEVCEKIFSGGTPSTLKEEYWSGNIPWLSSGETGNRYINKTEKFITEIGLHKSSAKYAIKGDVVIASAGQGKTRGQTSYLNIDTTINQSVLCFRANEEIINSKYLFFNLSNRYNEFRNISDSYSTRGSLTKDLIENQILLNLPPLQEQKSIAQILSTIDDKIENNLAINKTLEEMAMALYKHWFVDFGPFQNGEFVDSELGSIPKGWEVKSVYDIATYVNGAAFKPSELVEQGKYVIKISELNGGISKNTGKSNKQVKNEQIINDGSVLFSWSATLDIFLWDKGEALLNQHIFNVLPNGNLSIEILYFLLKNIIAHFKAIAADRATTMGHIKLSHLKETMISIPNEKYKNEFQNKSEPIFKQILENLIENQTLTQLRETLLPKLISGEVRLKEFREAITN